MIKFKGNTVWVDDTKYGYIYSLDGIHIFYSLSINFSFSANELYTIANKLDQLNGVKG